MQGTESQRFCFKRFPCTPELSGKYLLWYLLIFSPVLSFYVAAQTPEIDSLKIVIKQLPVDTNKVNTLNLVGARLYLLKDSSSLKYSKEAFNLADHLNYAKGKARALENFGFYHKNIHHPELALQYFDSALSIYRHANSRRDLAIVYNFIGIVHFEQENILGAIDYYEKALAINKALDIREKMATNLINIGLCYDNLGNTPKALEKYFEALAIDELLENKPGIAGDYLAIATLYSKQGDYKKAEEFFKKSLKIEKSLDNQQGIGFTLTNLGINFKKQKQFGEAIRCYEEALHIFQEIKYDYGQLMGYANLGILHYETDNILLAKNYLYRAKALGKRLEARRFFSDGYHYLSQIHFRSGHIDSALFYAKNGLAIAKEINSLEDITSLNLDLAQIYKTQKNYEQAFFYFEEHLKSKDSLFNKERSRQIKELQTKYETEKKEQQIALLNQEKVLQAAQLANKSLMQKLLYGVIGIILMFTFLGFRYTKIKQRNKRLLLSQQLESEKEEAERLQEMDRLKGRFFANIAHEFRTPLTLILGPLEGVIEQIKKKGHKEQLELVQSNASKLLRLINQLLDLSKLESGIVKLELVQDDIISFLKGITHSFHSLAEQKGIALTFQSHEEELIMDFDKDKIEKVLLNLLSNAFKFTPAEGHIHVEAVKAIREDKEGSFIKITVKDSGSGISKAHLSKVFNRFYQSETQVREAEGSGIGLALTKELVEVHGGSIEVFSAYEEGATFVFYLPISKEAPRFEEAPDNPKLEITAEENSIALESHLQDSPSLPADQYTAREIILVVEDNADVRRFISDSLRDSYKLIEAADGEEGIHLAKEFIPDLVISDVMMPGKDGYETCKALKADKTTSHIPVILLTAKAGLESKLEGLETGADDYLPKPFNTKELKARIKNLISLRKNLRERYLQHALSEEEQKPSFAIAPIEDSFLKKVRTVVEHHLEEEEFTVEDLSKELAMSRTQVHRKLKALTNQSASQFMRVIRLQNAKALLKNGIGNVSEVAYKVGFSSPTYFSTCFTEFYGYAPSEQKHK